MKVLVIQPKIGMGDMIIYLPYIHAISKKYKVKTSLLVKKNSRADELLADDPHIGEIISLHRTNNNSGEHDGFKGLFKLSNEIRLRNFDKVFIFSSSLRYNLIVKMAGIKNIYQYPLFRKKDNVVLSAKLFTEHKLNEIISMEPSIHIEAAKVKKAKSIFKNNFKHICLGFSASGPTKKWDVCHYIKLCEKLNNKFPCKFYLAGGRNDKDLIDRFLSSNIGSNCFSFGDLKIKETMPIIKNCNIYIGNDTGWLHISSALGLKCLALFMDSPVMAYGKYSKNINVIVPEGETEESTIHDTLGRNKISFDKVFNKAIELLS